jgi:hypothetical protein
MRSVVGDGANDAALSGACSDGAGRNGSALAGRTVLAESTSCCETIPGGNVPPRAETAIRGDGAFTTAGGGWPGTAAGGWTSAEGAWAGAANARAS